MFDNVIFMYKGDIQRRSTVRKFINESSFYDIVIISLFYQKILINFCTLSYISAGSLDAPMTDFLNCKFLYLKKYVMVPI